MNKDFDPQKNYEESRRAIAYVTRKEATQEDYNRIGFMSGLEVHQQLLTQRKLFCFCPAGIYHGHEEYDAEVIRHMRPTLSELGEYDGTALMEFKTRKNIFYRINNETACTYEIDDTPPFPIDREALEIALEISLLSKLNVVGEVHITRKQYLDGSIPTGFQRTAILGVEGEIPLKHKMVRLIQLSIEEDSCREISDIGHNRVYKTDRLGMPLIETVTYPDFVNPDEVKEGADYIRFLNRSTNKVRTGIGSTRADVNVSCRGGQRVEIKGVAHTRWMPELTHNEAFRQYSLLHMKDLINSRIPDKKNWKTSNIELTEKDFDFSYEPIKTARNQGYRILAVNLPLFQGFLSYFTQPGKCFANEISDRLKVIACIEKPNMVHSEQFKKVITPNNMNRIKEFLGAGEKDAQIVIWGNDADLKTALETIEERCLMAFDGIPPETRKGLPDGTTIFERVLPGADRMYPDTDSAPIPLEDKYIVERSKNLPVDISVRMEQLDQNNVPEDTHEYLLKNNMMPFMEQVEKDLGLSFRYIGIFLGHTLKYIEGQYPVNKEFTIDHVYKLFAYLKEHDLELELAKRMIHIIYQHPKMDLDSVLNEIRFKRYEEKDIYGKVPFLKKKFSEIRISSDDGVDIKWIMGELRKIALGNVGLRSLKNYIETCKV